MGNYRLKLNRIIDTKNPFSLRDAMDSGISDEYN